MWYGVLLSQSTLHKHESVSIISYCLSYVLGCYCRRHCCISYMALELDTGFAANKYTSAKSVALTSNNSAT